MAIEKLTARLNNKTWTNPQIKNHMKSNECRLIRPQTWIRMAWQRTSPQVTVIKKFCISSDDNMLCNGSEEAGNVRGECQEHEGTDCEDGDNDIDW